MLTSFNHCVVQATFGVKKGFLNGSKNKSKKKSESRSSSDTTGTVPQEKVSHSIRILKFGMLF